MAAGAAAAMWLTQGQKGTPAPWIELGWQPTGNWTQTNRWHLVVYSSSNLQVWAVATNLPLARTNVVLGRNGARGFYRASVTNGGM